MKDEKKVTIKLKGKAVQTQIGLLWNIHNEIVKMNDALGKMYPKFMLTQSPSPFMPTPPMYNNGPLFQSMQCPPPINPWKDNQHKDSELNPEDDDEWDDDDYDNTLAEIEIGDTIDVKYCNSTIKCIVIGVNEDYIEVVSLNVMFVSCMNKDQYASGGFVKSDLCKFLNDTFKSGLHDIQLSMYDDGVYVRIPNETDIMKDKFNGIDNPLYHIRNRIGIYIKDGTEETCEYWLENNATDEYFTSDLSIVCTRTCCISASTCAKNNANGVRVKFRIARNH